MADHRVVAVIGNSLGWYTALTVGDALDFDDAFQLVQGIALLQEEAAEGSGGQVIYPRFGADWPPAAELVAAIDSALVHGGEVFPRGDLGGDLVRAGGTEERRVGERGVR